MEISVPLWLVIFLGIMLVLAAGTAIWRARQPGPAAKPLPGPVQTASTPDLAQELGRLQAAGQWDALLKLLDRRLPEWTVSSSLIEVARSLGSLERELAAVPASPVSEVVTTRLTHQAHAVSSDLWRLAARIDATARQGHSRARGELEREDATLVLLLASIQEARSEVADLALGGLQGSTLDRAEGRFRALAETARELRELDGESGIR